MPTKDQFIKEVDGLLSVVKTLAGAEHVAWQDGRNEDEPCIKIPIEVEGVQYGTELLIVAYPLEPGKFSIVLIHYIAVCRLDIVDESEIHSNPLDALGLANMTLIRGPHFHSWPINRRLIESATKAQRLRMAEPYEGSKKLMAALRWFCGQTNILVPHGVSIELPDAKRLL